MTDPTTNPILEKMARAIISQANSVNTAVVDDCIYCGEDNDGDVWLSATDLAQAALRSLLPLDEEGVASAASSLSMAPFPSQRSKTSAKRTLTAFINHAIGGE